MTAYRSFWVITAILLSLVLFGYDQGMLAWFLEKFSGTGVRVGSAIILGIFLFGFGVIGHRAGLRLSHDEEATSRLEQLIPAGMPDDGKVEVVRGLLKEGLNGLNETAVGKCLIALGERVRTMIALNTTEPVSRGLFQDDFENRLADEIDLLEAIRTLLFFIGLLGTVVGIIIALVGQIIPSTPDETKLFSFNMIQGMGLAYVTTMLGISSGVVLYILETIYKMHAMVIARRFGDKMFRIVFPTIHSVAFGYKPPNNTQEGI